MVMTTQELIDALRTQDMPTSLETRIARPKMIRELYKQLDARHTEI